MPHFVRQQVAEVFHLAPERVRLLRSFDPDAPVDAEVPDPYYGGPEGFTEVLGMVRAAMPGMIDWVRARR